MRILLTGATGFAGAVYLNSISSEDEVVVLGRSRPKNLQPHATFFEANLADAQSVKTTADSVQGEFDALVHLAAYVPKQGKTDLLKESSEVNIDGLVHVLEAFDGRIKRIVLGSTVEVYDQSQLQLPITSNSPVGPVSYYAATKLASEFVALSYGRKNAVPTVILRFSVMYGPDDPIERALPNFIKKALANELIEVNTKQRLRDYVHVSDVAMSIEKALHSSVTGIITIGSGVGVAIGDAAEQIIQLAGSSSQTKFEEGPGVDIVIDAREAKEKIGFVAAMHFPDGLKEMIDSYRK